MAEPKIELIANRYSVLYTLGKGGMGVVFRCRDSTLQRDVAVKVLGQGADVETAKRFQTEAKAAAKLQHENILQVMDFGESDGRLFLVMDYLDGMTLTDLIREKKRLEPEQAIPIFLQICKGLAHAHDKGVLHRDIKPSNIMLMESEFGWNVKIVDFGIAKISSNADQKLTTTGTVIGSPLYISPEAGLGKKCDSRSDIYSLGCLMYETLTGNPPFQGDTAFETIMMHNNDMPPPMSSNAGMSFNEHLEGAVNRCIEKLPQNRFQTTEELSKALSSILEASKPEGLEPAPVRPAEEIHSTRQSDLWKKSALLTVFIIIAIGVIYSASKMQSDHDEGEEKPITKTTSPISVGVFPEAPPELERVTPPSKPFTLRVDSSNVKTNGPVDDAQLSANALKYKNATSWNMQGAAIKGPGLKSLLASPIRSLEMKETPIGEDAIKTISKMKMLDHLDIRRCSEIRPEHLKPLAQLKYLTTIQLSLPSDRESAVRMIDALSDLKSISAATIDGEVTTEMVVKLKRLPNLHFLKAPFLHEGQDSESLGRALGDLPQLTVLLAVNDGLDAVVLKELGKRQDELRRKEKISQLNVYLPESSEQSLATVKAMSNLPDLVLLTMNGYIDTASLKEACKLPKLKQLIIPDDPDISLPAELRKLKSTPNPSTGSRNYMFF